MKFLCHAGPWSDEYFRFVVKEMYPNAECVLLSPHKNIDESGGWRYYYENVEKNKRVKFTASEEDLDIIARCRLMRAIPLQEALLHLNSMRQAIGRTLDEQKPTIVLTEAVDSFAIDLLNYESVKRGIPCLGFVTVFVNGHYRISVKGEYTKLRDASNEDVQAVLDKLLETAYLPSFVVNDSNNLVKSTVRKWVRNLIKIPYFYLKRFTSGDKYNNHYWQSYIVSMQWASWLPETNLGDPKWQETIERQKQTVVYLPLQMFPEATIDYWCDSKDVIDYENVVIDFVKQHPDITFLVKEHPSVSGFRSARFYKRLDVFDNVVFVPTTVPSNSLQEHYAAVLVWTGTVGFECAIRGKPVLCMSKPYYFTDDADFLLTTMQTSSKEINEYIANFDANKTHEYQYGLVKHVMDGCLPGRVRFDGSFSPDIPEYAEEARHLSVSLKAHIEKLL